MENTLKSLYNRALSVEREILMLQESLKELKTEFTYCKDSNTSGFDKETVGRTLKAAKASAKEDDLVEKVSELNEVLRIQEDYDN